MSAYSTERITRQDAYAALLAEVPMLPNDLLADVLNLIAHSGKSRLYHLNDYEVHD